MWCLLLLVGWLLLPSLVLAQRDREAPEVVITTPTSEGTYTTSATPLLVAGTASDNRRVRSVTWTTSQGGSGSAQGTTHWSASIPLQPGVTHLTVRARDNAENLGEDVLSITRTTVPPPAESITVIWEYRTAGGDAFQLERCSPEGPTCPMGLLAEIALTLREWIDTAVVDNGRYCYRMAVRTAGSLGSYSNTLCSPED